MTSRISFAKMVKSDLKRRLWVAALLFLGYFLVMPVQTMMRFENMYSSVSAGYIHVEEIFETVAVMLGAGNELVMMGVICSAVMAAFSGFSYLHSSRKVDLFHSFAIKRERLFAVQYVSGFLVFALPYGINLLLNLIVCIANGVVNGTVISSLFVGILVHLIYFLLIYHLSIIAVLMTGKLLVSVLGLIVFCGWSLLTSSTIIAYFEQCFDTYYQLKETLLQKICYYLSPLEQYIEFCSEFYRDEAAVRVLLEHSKEALIALVEAVLLLLFAVFLYKKRPSEAAGNAMAFPRWNPLIKVLILIPLTAFGGLFMTSFSGNGGFGWLIFGIVFVGIVAHCLTEVIYSYDFKKIVTHKGTLGITLVVVLGFAFCCWFDLIGYDKKLPESEELQSIAVSLDQVDDHISYQVENLDDYANYNARDLYRLTNGQMTDVTAAYQLAKAGVENEKLDFFDLPENDTPGMGINVSYILKNGKEMTRRYLVSYDQVKQSIASLYATEKFKLGQYPLLSMDIEHTLVDTIIFDDAYYDSEKLNFSIGEIKEFLNCYQKELAAATYEKMQPENIIGSFAALDMTGSAVAERYLIYDSFTETVDFLEQHGYQIHRIPDVEDVTSISVYNYEWEEEQFELAQKEGAMEITESGERVFEDPDNIETILKAMVHSETAYYLTDQSYNLTISMEIKGEKGITHKTMEGAFIEGEIPKCVLEAYE